MEQKITCLVTCVVTKISYMYFHLSKQSRPSSGSSYKRSIIWVNSVCKSVKMRLCDVTEVKCLICHKHGRSFIILYFYSCQSYPLQLGAHILPYLKMCEYSRGKFIEKCFTLVSSDLMSNFYMYISASFVYI